MVGPTFEDRDLEGKGSFDSSKYVKHCHEVLILYYSHQHTYAGMNNIITKGKSEILCVNFLGPLSKATWGLKHLIVCVDAFTKLVKLYAVTRPTTRSVLDVILNKYISEHGHVKRVLTDNGKQFSNKLWSHTLT